MKKTYISALVLALILSAGATSVYAQSNETLRLGLENKTNLGLWNNDRDDDKNEDRDEDKNENDGFSGVVTAVGVNTLTITNQKTGTVYTINTLNAKIERNDTTILLSGIAVGDIARIEGTLSGSVVTASEIEVGAKVKKEKEDKNDKWNAWGTITAINGSTITITSKFRSNTTPTTYTVNAANAEVKKNGEASVITNLAVGDMIMIKGTISSTTIVASKVHSTNRVSIPDGNGQPIVGGKVTAVSGTTITLMNKSNVSYTIDAKSASFSKNGKVATISEIAVGDSILVQGTISGTSVTAVSVIEQDNTQENGNNGKQKGFFRKMSSFFSRLFGF